MIVSGIWLALLGVLAAPNLLLARRPDAKTALLFISPFQSMIGAGSAVYGLWGLVKAVFSIGATSVAPALWLTQLAGSLLQVALGMLLGIGTLKMFITDDAARDKMDKTLTKLAPHQGRLGLAAICLGAWMVLATFLW